MNSINKTARIAGFLYLSLGPFALFAFIYIPRNLIVRGDALATASNIMASQTLFRLGIVSSLLTSIIMILVVVALHQLLKPVNKNMAALMVMFVLIAVPIAMLALICRVAEGLAGMFMPRTLALLWLATTTGANALDTETAHALGEFLLKMGAWSPSAIFFAVGSTLFSWLFLGGRMIPVALAWLGVLASVLLVVILPLQFAGLFGGAGNWLSAVTWLMWLPMLVYEVGLALWLITKGVAMPTPNVAPSRAD